MIGFLRNRRGKKEKKGGTKKDSNGNTSGKEEKSEGSEDNDESLRSEASTGEIDKEGYSVPPKSAWDEDKGSFYSSSDTDSEDEREKGRLHVEIKPLTNGTSPKSASVDELRSTIENLTLTRSIGTGSRLLGSRGPSPLTIGMADTIPLAVAFHEIIHASFKGNDENKCQIKMTGDMMVSFPAGIIQVFMNNPAPAQLSFRVRSLLPLDNLVSNKELVRVKKVSGGLNFEFHMSTLIAVLREQAERNPQVSYFNVDIFKYHISPKPGAASCPMHLVAFWKCETSHTDLRIDYKYNCHAIAQQNPTSSGSSVFLSSPSDSSTYPALLQVCIAAPVEAEVKSMQSKPAGQWYPATNRACWKIPSLSYNNENLGIGSLRARFEINNGPSTPGIIAAQFNCENSTLSGCDFELTGIGYRVSLVKKRFVSGKYTCEAVGADSDTEREKQLHIEIKPLSNGKVSPKSATIDAESTIENLTLTRSIGTGSQLICSRGPSPFAIGMADTIPLAVAFHEIIHASFRENDESKCQIKMTGDMMVSFPAGTIHLFTNNPAPAQLSFHVRSLLPLDNLVSNKELVNVETVSDGITFEFNMSALINVLKIHAKQNPEASFFNIDILKYQVSPKPGAVSCPLHLVAFWKCETSHTDLRIDYKYNSHAIAQQNPTSSGSSFFLSSPDSSAYPALLQVCIAAPVEGEVKSMQSKPAGQWFPATNRACWKIPSLSYDNENLGVGSLRSRFEIRNGPSTPGIIAAQFSCENSTLSGCDFELTGVGYKVSLVKKRFVSGKYTCEAVGADSGRNNNENERENQLHIDIKPLTNGTAHLKDSVEVLRSPVEKFT